MNTLRKEYADFTEKESQNIYRQNQRRISDIKTRILQIKYAGSIIPSIEQIQTRIMRCNFPFIAIPIQI